MFYPSEKKINSHLEKYYNDRRKHTIDLGKAAINELLKEGKKVTYRAIADKSKEIDPDKKGFDPNTVKTNSELYNYYLDNRNHKRTSTRKLSHKQIPLDSDYTQLKHDRDITRVKQRYMKLTKNELIDRLVDIEQYVAIQQKNWLEKQFEKYL
jgi:hypothetical protein